MRRAARSGAQTGEQNGSLTRGGFIRRSHDDIYDHWAEASFVFVDVQSVVSVSFFSPLILTSDLVEVVWRSPGCTMTSLAVPLLTILTLLLPVFAYRHLHFTNADVCDSEGRTQTINTGNGSVPPSNSNDLLQAREPSFSHSPTKATQPLGRRKSVTF